MPSCRFSLSWARCRGLPCLQPFGRVLGVLAVLAASASAAVAQQPAEAAKPQQKAEKPAAKQREYIRLARDKAGDPAGLETAVVHFVPAAGAAGLKVDLIGAVHIADKDYYDQLNKRFEKYDVLLYELVAAKGSVPKPGQAGHSAISQIQTAMKDFLELDFQLDDVDYTKENFVHADMSPEELAKSMRDKGESVWTIMMKMMATSMAKQGGGSDISDFDLLMAMFDKNRALQMKRLLAGEMADSGGMMAALDGAAGSSLIADRNKAALKVLKEQIDAGKKRIGIFYGAGHFRDMEKRLTENFGLKRDSEEWLSAWDLKLPKEEAAKKPVEKAGK